MNMPAPSSACERTPMHCADMCVAKCREQVPNLEQATKMGKESCGHGLFLSMRCGQHIGQERPSWSALSTLCLGPSVCPLKAPHPWRQLEGTHAGSAMQALGYLAHPCTMHWHQAGQAVELVEGGGGTTLVRLTLKVSAKPAPTFRSVATICATTHAHLIRL